MHKSERLLNLLKKSRLVALLNPRNKAECVRAYQICQKNGIILEIALRSEYAEQGIDLVLDKYPDALLLAGTVMTEKQAKKVIELGVAGVVSADYIPDVVKICTEKDVMCVPGGLSDVGKQLVLKAKQYKCSLNDLQKRHPYQWVYKLFPAFSGDMNNMFLKKAWSGPFSQVTVFYTGGIRLNNLEKAQAIDPEGIFCASALTKNVADPDRMEKEIKQWKKVLNKKKKKPGKDKKILVESDSISKAVTFGELMLRLSPDKGVRLENSNQMNVHFGGAEANVAVCLARFGINSFFVSAIPRNDIGDHAVNSLKIQGVNTSYVQRSGHRLGIYYLEHGSGPRPSKVIYDRKGSSISHISPDDVEWEEVLKDAQWFHWTGITPALGDSVKSCLRRGLETAQRLGVRVSADLNYRKKLWKEEKANEVMTELMKYTNIMIGNEEDPTYVFGIKSGESDVSKGELNIKGYEQMMKKLYKRFDLEKVAVTLRESLSASENKWSACLYNGKDFILGSQYRVLITDRVGTGDAFAAGLIFSLLKGEKDKQALEFGIASAVFKHTLYGDFNITSVEEIKRLAQGETHGRVQR
ncbi:MAG: KHG/KDPG aldolase/sugar kinase fusion protein [Candidatus Aminicenantes bacterium]